jgi:hypothetical protein
MKTMLKIKNVLMCLIVSLLVGSCAKKNDDKDITAKIFYPEKNIYENTFGSVYPMFDNLLYQRSDSSGATLKLKVGGLTSYYFDANIPKGQSVKVIIRNKSDFFARTLSYGYCDPWQFNRPGKIGWSMYPVIGDYDFDLRTTTLIANGPVKATVGCYFTGGCFGGVGRADIEIYENDAQEPTRIVKVTW